MARANRDAKATGFTAPKEWPKELTQKWKVTVGLGDASPAVVGNKLYVFAREGTDEVIRCLDATNGKELWSEKYDATQVSGPPPRHTADHEARLQWPMAKSSRSASAVSSPAWMPRRASCSGARTISRAPGPGSTRPPRRSSPTASAIAALGSESNGGIVAYDLASGDQKWKWTGDGTAYASPMS